MKSLHTVERTATVDFSQVFLNVKDSATKLETTTQTVLTKIKNSDLFAIKVVGQWRVLFLDINTQSLRTDGVDELDYFYEFLPEFLAFNVVCELFKIRKYALLELIYKGLLSSSNHDGVACIAGSNIIRYIEDANNFTELTIPDSVRTQEHQRHFNTTQRYL